MIIKLSIAAVFAVIIAIVLTVACVKGSYEGEIEALERQIEAMKNYRSTCLFNTAKVYRRKYRYINIENAGDNDTLNRTAQKYHEEDYDLDREKSTDRLLVFVKCEEVKEEESV